MTINQQALASVRVEYARLREDLRQIEAGKWSGVTKPEIRLLRLRLHRLAVLVVMNDYDTPTSH